MSDWLDALQRASEAGRPSVLVTIADAKGSAPREAGVKMLVSETDAAGTVGGGNLEHQALRIARALLAKGAERSELRSFALGPSLGQCCGGATRLLFEPMPAGRGTPDWAEALSRLRRSPTASVLASEIEGRGDRKLLVTAAEAIGAPADPALIEAARDVLARFDEVAASLWRDAEGRRFLLERLPGSQGDVLLIGAGHVGKALMRILPSLPFRIVWADNRPEQFPDDVPDHVEIRCTPHLEQTIDEAPKDNLYLVMTYSHDLDYALCARVLKRGDFRYLGLIGSKTKRARFEKTMRDLGFEQAQIDRVVCPIGVPGIASKLPAAIAVATAAQLLTLGSSTASGANAKHPGA